MKIVVKLVLLVSCFQQIFTFDMWEIIEKENRGDATKNRTKGRFGGPQHAESNIIDGDIIREVKLAAPTTGLWPLFSWHKRLWMKREIPYLIIGALTQVDKTRKIKESLKKISDVTCLRFRPKQSSDKHWLQYYAGSGCASGVGRKYFKDYKPTEITLGTNCVHPSIIVHETLHALGFPHEQSRYDRDSFVKIYDSRILNVFKNNFEKNDLYEIDTQGTPYDYHSIMHYSKRSFARYPTGNTIEAKFDPNMKLGGGQLSPIDITEINRLYQCDVKNGWGRWTNWSPCIQKQWGDYVCTKAKVRVCFSKYKSDCPGADENGVEEIVEKCSKSECEADKKKKDGQWGNWGPFSKCSGPCGWGRTERHRQCNNPSPASGGKQCVGNIKELRLCRNKRCGKAFPQDNSFDSVAWGNWKSKGFTIKYTSHTNSWNEGPSRDHTSEIRGRTYKSYYASAKNQAGKYEKMQLWSPFIHSFSGQKCLSFYYMLNGINLHPTNALSVFLKDQKNNYLNLAFHQGGHQGNYWKRHSLRINSVKAPFQFVFEFQTFGYRPSEVAIDDIYFDHNDCQKGLTGCTDVRKDCQQLASTGSCNSKTQFRKMLGECCATCNDPHYQKITETCTDSKQACYYWSKTNLCTSEKYKAFMDQNCCASCKKGTPTCKTDDNAKCEKWAKEGECEKNKKWMLINCCASCFKFGQ